jgi:hypothetical protein
VLFIVSSLKPVQNVTGIHRLIYAEMGVRFGLRLIYSLSYCPVFGEHRRIWNGRIFFDDYPRTGHLNHHDTGDDKRLRFIVADDECLNHFLQHNRIF